MRDRERQIDRERERGRDKKGIKESSKGTFSLAHTLPPSISSTFYVQIFRTNIVFSSYMYVEKAAEMYVRTNIRT